LLSLLFELENLVNVLYLFRAVSGKIWDEIVAGLAKTTVDEVFLVVSVSPKFYHRVAVVGRLFAWSL